MLISFPSLFIIPSINTLFSFPLSHMSFLSLLLPHPPYKHSSYSSLPLLTPPYPSLLILTPSLTALSVSLLLPTFLPPKALNSLLLSLPLLHVLPCLFLLLLPPSDPCVSLKHILLPVFLSGHLNASFLSIKKVKLL